jgi:hypothetical protein
MHASHHGPPGETLPPDPVEELADHAGLVEDHRVVRHVGPRRVADVAIPIRGVHERAHRASRGRIPSPTSCPLDDLGPFILRDAPLDLHQELVFWGLLALPVEKHDAHAAEFLEHERLQRILAGQAIWTLHRDDLNAAHGGQVAQPFQGGTYQRGPAGTRINEDAGCSLRIAGPPFAPSCSLTIHGLGRGLTVGGDPRLPGHGKCGGYEHR